MWGKHLHPLRFKFKFGDWQNVNVAAHVFCDYNLAIILIFAVLEL